MKTREDKACEMADTAQFYADDCRTVYAVEMLALAIEATAECENIHNWICSEESVAYLKATATFVDAIHNHRQLCEQAEARQLREQDSEVPA